MGQESPSFIVSPTDIERSEKHSMPPTELIVNEIKTDYPHYFSVRGQEITEKMLAGNELSGEESSVFDREVANWWQDKYGFPFERKSERNEVIARKYMVPDELVRRRSLQVELFAAIRNNDHSQLQELRDRYVSEYPEQLEGVEVLIGFPEYINLQEKVKFLAARSNNPDEIRLRKEAFQSLTEFNFLLSHFVEQNSDDKEFLEQFWGILEEMGATSGNLRQAQMTRRGVLSQVAALKIFEKLGQHPTLSHPSQDAFDAIDMWTDGDKAIQIKTGQHLDDELLVDTDEIAFPGVQTKGTGDSIRMINTDLMTDISRFQTKSSAYGKRIGKNVSGYYAVIPKQSYDHVTGIPSENIIRRFANKLGIAYPEAEDELSQSSEAMGAEETASEVSISNNGDINIPKTGDRKPLFTLGPEIISQPTKPTNKESGRKKLRTMWGKRR